jgi:hypothetical protein
MSLMPSRNRGRFHRSRTRSSDIGRNGYRDSEPDGGRAAFPGPAPFPRFSHRGLATILINLTIPGPGNTISLTVGPATF